ncbi:hypothetical protein GF362_00265 [Candidatus Dojkabacteria bacterium]|nr:hypothetical protein [Candidatus Dojkabacteria bacterium]
METDYNPIRTVLQHYCTRDDPSYNEVILVNPRYSQVDIPKATELIPSFSLETSEAGPPSYLAVFSPDRFSSLWDTSYPECTNCSLQCTQSAFGRYPANAQCPILQNPELPVHIFEQSEENNPFRKK